MKILMIKICLLFLLGFLTSSTNEQKEIAFPGAEGYGKYTTGGRDGLIYTVTNLNDSGKGSLREGIELENSRIIVFQVSGIIYLKSPLTIRNGNISVLGQTAPKPGITITGFPVEVFADNVIVRYLTIRLSDLNNVEGDALECKDAKNVIFDHLSLSWGVDENATFYRTENLTLQWSSISESLNNSIHKKGNHGYGGIWGGTNVSYHHNFLACNSNRNPRFCGSRAYLRNTDKNVEFYNNVVYNWVDNAIYGGEEGTYNIINNTFIPGPATKKSKQKIFLKPYEPLGKYYVSGNFMHDSPKVSENNSLGIEVSDITKVLVSSPYPSSPDFEPQSTQEALKYVLEKSGNSLYRDSHDNRIFNYLLLNSPPIYGIIDTQKNVGGLEESNTKDLKSDTDQDGMPDKWEIKNKLDPIRKDATENSLHRYYNNIEIYSHDCIKTNN